MSFDDLFWKRDFSSYINKESNVFDRSVSPNYEGLDALLESERIRNEIFLLNTIYGISKLNVPQRKP